MLEKENNFSSPISVLGRQNRVRFRSMWMTTRPRELGQEVNPYQSSTKAAIPHGADRFACPICGQKCGSRLSLFGKSTCVECSTPLVWRPPPACILIKLLLLSSFFLVIPKLFPFLQDHSLYYLVGAVLIVVPSILFSRWFGKPCPYRGLRFLTANEVDERRLAYQTSKHGLRKEATSDRVGEFPS